LLRRADEDFFAAFCRALVEAPIGGLRRRDSQLVEMKRGQLRGDFVWRAPRVPRNGKGKCSGCHVPPLFTEPGNNLHAPSEVGVDSFQADRSPTHMYRTSPLAGLWSHANGGFYHDGRFATLQDVVEHYNGVFHLGLSESEKSALVEYLKSL